MAILLALLGWNAAHADGTAALASRTTGPPFHSASATHRGRTKLPFSRFLAIPSSARRRLACGRKTVQIALSQADAPALLLPSIFFKNPLVRPHANEIPRIRR